MENNYDKPFGNTISRSALFFTKLSVGFCKLFFGKRTPDLDLVAIPKGQVYKDFNVWTLVRRDDEKAMTDPETGKILKYEEINPKKSLVIGTIRMGFGHWRIAIALASAAHKLGVKSYLLDLMSFSDTSIAKSIKFLENYYNGFSRLSQKWKWFNDHIWENVTSKTSLTLDSALQQRLLSEFFVPAFAKIPKEVPVVAAHPWVGHAAVINGTKRVVSMIPDNLPLAFWLVEGSIHTVQSPSGYMGYRTLIHMEKGHPIEHCLKDEEIILAGHYVDYELTSNISVDCKARLARMKKGEPRRLLLTMGGAGAQALKFADIAKYCTNYINQKKATLLINMGDHKGRWEILKEQLEKNKIPYVMHDNWKKTQKFVSDMNDKEVSGVHIFLHSDFYAAVYTTNILMRYCDFMITKPSELSFYPIPKLFIQRVGRHEAWGAIRGSEIGDGTKEVTTSDILHRVLTLIIEEDDLFKYNISSIENNNKVKMYDGALEVVRIALK
ncbi:DUF6938 domain-containing protein [Treponema sp.]|uniref:DUF6938 domain-containing protein n=1 Tax=Treponema sp. TaxID=166 RepID=UPI00298E06AF|nr:hypothetical protein [Treponema sp.]MCR5613704.1 hypothetical protein [Treponema sp.]